MIKGIYEAIDEKDVTSFCNFLTPDCTFRFGNSDSVSGRENVKQYVSGFFDSIEGLSHEIIDSWDVPDGKVCHGYVTYTRKDSSKLSVPFSTILKIDGAGVSEHLIFADISQLYA
jgi:ketosteroid isomerase-like protein